MGAGLDWKQEHVIALTNAFNAGMSYRQIVNKLTEEFPSVKWTIGMIAGKCQGLHLKRARKVKAKKVGDQRTKHTTRVSPMALNLARERAFDADAQGDIAAVSRMEELFDGSKAGRPLLRIGQLQPIDNEPTTCRWPYDTEQGYRFCGRNAIKAWCTDHAIIATRGFGAYEANTYKV